MGKELFIYLFLVAIILLLIFRNYSLALDLDNIKSRDGSNRIKPSTLPPPPPRIKRKHWRFVLVENYDQRTLDDTVNRLLDDGYNLDEEVTKDNYLAFIKIEWYDDETVQEV